LMPNSRPRIVFDENGVCNACHTAAAKAGIDWDARRKEFMSLIEKYRGKGDSDGVALAEVAVDTETGVVRVLKVVIVQQCGIVVNRKTAESQIAGSAIQGVGFALFEERIMNAVNGAHVNPNMEWYKLPGPVDIPEIVPILDVPEDATGVRSLGEPTLVGVPAAIANAVANATGARVRSLPLTPAKVMAAMSEKGAKA